MKGGLGFFQWKLYMCLGNCEGHLQIFTEDKLRQHRWAMFIEWIYSTYLDQGLFLHWGFSVVPVWDKSICHIMKVKLMLFIQNMQKYNVAINRSNYVRNSIT